MMEGNLLEVDYKNNENSKILIILKNHEQVIEKFLTKAGRRKSELFRKGLC